jgi:hypothetical protein
VLAVVVAVPDAEGAGDAALALAVGVVGQVDGR